MIVDFHTHIVPPFLKEQREEYLARDATLAALFADPASPMATAEELVAAMNAAGIDQAVVLQAGTVIDAHAFAHGLPKQPLGRNIRQAAHEHVASPQSVENPNRIGLATRKVGADASEIRFAHVISEVADDRRPSCHVLE